VKTFLPISCVAALLLFGGCGLQKKTTSIPKPLVRETGKPITVSVLGYNYTIPGQIDVPDYSDIPGRYYLEFIDRINRCEGYIHFETTAESSTHLTYTKSQIDALEANWKQLQIAVETKIEEIPLLKEEARSVYFDLSKSTNTASAQYIDHHFAAKNLSIIAYTFCLEPSFLPETSRKIVGLINSQVSEEEPSPF
jgi:hypothetical protein